MSTSKFRIKTSPEAKGLGSTKGVATGGFMKILGCQAAPEVEEPRSSADRIEDDGDESAKATLPAPSPKTPATAAQKPITPSPAANSHGKSAARTFLSSVSRDIAFHRPQDRPRMRGAYRGPHSSLAAHVGSMPQQTIGLASSGKQTFTITGMQPEAHVLKCLCTPIGTAESTQAVLVLLKASIGKSLDTTQGAPLTISLPWTELPSLPGTPPVLIPWLVTNAVP